MRPYCHFLSIHKTFINPQKHITMYKELTQMRTLIESGLSLIDKFIHDKLSYLYRIAKEKGVTRFGYLGPITEEDILKEYGDWDNFSQVEDEYRKWLFSFVEGCDYTERCKVFDGIAYELFDDHIVVLRTYRFFEEKYIEEKCPLWPSARNYGNFENMILLIELMARELGIEESDIRVGAPVK